MRRALSLTLATAIAIPLLAEEAKKDETKRAHATAVQEQTAQPVATTDSPLVAAAKRANRLGKKPKNVITNDTLVRSGGNSHITTTTTPVPLPKIAPNAPPPRPTPEMIHAEKVALERKRQKEAEDRQRKAEDAARRRQAAAGYNEEDGHDGTRDDADQYVGHEDVTPPPQH